MPIAKADAKRRVILPEVKPGDVFDVQNQGDGRLVLVRLERRQPGPRMSRTRCLDAIAAAPLRMQMDWDSLGQITREP